MFASGQPRKPCSRDARRDFRRRGDKGNLGVTYELDLVTPGISARGGAA
jgi:hypothetical protein